MTKLFCDHCAKELVDVFLRVGLSRTTKEEALDNELRHGSYTADLLYCSADCASRALAVYHLATSLTR